MTATTIATALRQILLDDYEVAAMVSTRVHPVSRPQGGALPAIVYQLITTGRRHTTDGPVYLTVASFQVTAWDSTYLGAAQVAEYVRQALDGYDGTVGTVTIQAVAIVDEGDVPSLIADNEELNLYGRRLVIEMYFNEV